MAKFGNLLALSLVEAELAVEVSVAIEQAVEVFAVAFQYVQAAHTEAESESVVLQVVAWAAGQLVAEELGLNLLVPPWLPLDIVLVVELFEVVVHSLGQSCVFQIHRRIISGTKQRRSNLDHRPFPPKQFHSSLRCVV